MRRPVMMRNLFLGAALLLSHLMCAVVAYAYCALEWGGRYAGYSAPPGAALVYLIPYGLGIACCLAMAWFFHRRAKS